MTPEQALQKLEGQYKRQNKHIKDNYDRLSTTHPKGTKDQILATGYSINNFVVEAVKEKLVSLEVKKSEPKPENVPDWMIDV
jgi:hypothetical protein